MIEGLLIDLGNTIVYNRHFDFKKGFKKVYELAINPKISLEQYMEFNKHLKMMTYDNRGDLEIKLIDYLSFVSNYFDLKFNIPLTDIEVEFAKACEKLELIEGIKDILIFCKSHNIKVVVLSNSAFSKNAILSQLEPLNISYLIDEFLISSESLFRKPHQLFFELGIKTLGCTKENILYIGNDYNYDIIGASKAGLNVGWFNELHQNNYQNLNCFDFDNYSSLLKYLEGLK